MSINVTIDYVYNKDLEQLDILVNVVNGDTLTRYIKVIPKTILEEYING